MNLYTFSSHTLFLYVFILTIISGKCKLQTSIFVTYARYTFVFL